MTGIKNIERADDMCFRFKSGETLKEIGRIYGVTREYVRQVIKKHGGLVGCHGGQSVVTNNNRIIREAKLDAKYIKKHGCSYAQYRMLIKNKATRRFAEQKRNAAERGVEWKFKGVWDWWIIWDESGKWAERGRGQGKYCMARHGDLGAYEAGNVFICLCVENNSNRKEKKSGLPVGVIKKVVKNYVAYIAHKMVDGKSYHVGSFKTPDQAHAAYLSFGVSQ